MMCTGATVHYICSTVVARFNNGLDIIGIVFYLKN